MLRPIAAGAALLLCLGAAPPDKSVTIDNFSFTPAALTVDRGTLVIWTNHDDIPHTVTSADHGNPFRSPPLDTDDRFSYRFDQAGRFTYFCSLHAHMQGVVVVR